MTSSQASYFIMWALSVRSSARNDHPPPILRTFENIQGYLGWGCYQHLMIRGQECRSSLSHLEQDYLLYPNKDLYGTKCQYCWGCEILTQTEDTLGCLFKKRITCSMCGSRIQYTYFYFCLYLLFILLVVVLLSFSALYEILINIVSLPI